MKKSAISILVVVLLLGLLACAAGQKGFLAVKVCTERQCSDASGKPGPRESGIWKSAAELGGCECLAWELQVPGVQK